MTRSKHLRISKLKNVPALAGMFLCALCVAMPAKAQQTAGFFSGAYLRELCASDAKGKELVKNGHTACQSYISGIVDYHMLLKSLGSQPIIDICVPNTVPMKKLQNIVWLFLEQNKQHSEFIAAPAVTLALYDHYPCPKKRRR